MEITEPMAVDMPDTEYFAHPAFSCSDAKLLLNETPAKFRYIKDNAVERHSDEFDFGHVVHELALGKGAGIDVIDADDWRTKAAREARDESYANGRAPILTARYEEAKACADGLRRHPIAKKLLDNMDHAEVALFWNDNGVDRKAKLDGVTGRFVFDVKSMSTAATDAFGRSAGKFGYFMSDAWYRDAAAACLGVDEPKFLYLVVEKEPPYLVNVIELDPYDVELGRKRNQRAIDLYRRCVESGEWPGYGTGINQAQLPRWAEMEEEAA